MIMYGVIQIFDSKSIKSLKITNFASISMNKKYDKNTKDSKARNAAKARRLMTRNWNGLTDTIRNMRQEEGAKIT